MKNSEENSPTQAPITLKERVRLLWKESGLSQQELADLMGVKLDRVKSLALGKVKEIHRLEVKALEEKLGVNPRWITDGDLPMWLRDKPLYVPAPPSAPLTAEEAFSGYGGPLDMELMTEVMKVVEAGLERRGVTLSAERRVRLYRGLYEFSLPLGHVNMRAVEPILDVVAPRE